MNAAAPRLIIAIAAAVAVSLGAIIWFRASSRPPPSAVGATNPLELLNAYEEQEAQKHWGPELIAQQYGRVVERLWDRLNSSSNKLTILRDLSLDCSLAKPTTPPSRMRHGILVHAAHGSSWPAVLDHAIQSGWVLEQCEFRHIRFVANARGAGPESAFYTSGHLVNPSTSERAIIEGDLTVRWRGTPQEPAIAKLDASQLQVRRRTGAPPFTRVLNEEIAPFAGSYFIDPVIVWDLNNDGQREIILAARNLALERQTNGSWAQRELCEQPIGLVFLGMLGDFTGDGHADYITATFDGLVIREGTSDGRFPGEGRLAWAAQPRLRYAQTITSGDIDADGDLDLFLGQYKVPYDQGQMPFPYFAAADGHPSFVLLNDGAGSFTDATETAGLGSKRLRRVYSSSFVDLDRDNDLDLLTVSDFSGADAWQNNGQGQFTDVTDRWFPKAHALGMGHSFADFNADGLLDVIIIGMNSPVAERLASLGLNRPYETADAGMRDAITYGNRLLFGTSDGPFVTRPMSEAVAHTGWSWGSTAADFDGDALPDLYIANGHETKATVQDYETEFWLHDIYVGKSIENALAHRYFQEKFRRTRGRGHSYGGYERNRFFLNLGGTNFLEAGHLFGLAMPEDSRNVVAQDLNNDGKRDLIVTTFEVHPEPRQTIQIFENHLPQLPPSEARARLAPAPAVQGESYRVQIQP